MPPELQCSLQLKGNGNKRPGIVRPASQQKGPAGARHRKRKRHTYKLFTRLVKPHLLYGELSRCEMRARGPVRVCPNTKVVCTMLPGALGNGRGGAPRGGRARGPISGRASAVDHQLESNTRPIISHSDSFYKDRPTAAF